MGIYVNPINDAFCISVNDDIYIDKSGLISFVNSKIGKRKRFICVSRPRRFGKSMAAEMLAAYYDKNSDSHKLFDDLEIAKDDSYQKHLNQYNVIFLNIQQFLSGIKEINNLVNYLEESVLEELQEIYGELIPKEEKRLSTALTNIYLKDNHPNKGFIFIIDEWDCIFREAKGNTQAQIDYLDFLRDLFKDRVYVKMAYMTGILPIKKYGTHSALNIFDEYSMLYPDILSNYVGFTEKEVKDLCAKYNKDFEEMKRWYDGYIFLDDIHIYNPKSVIDAISSKRFRSYWTTTETYEALQIYIDLDMDGLKQAIISMLSGNKCKIDVGAFQNDMTSFKSKDDVFTLLVHLGYLAYEEISESVFIPNEEVRMEFIRAVKNGNRPELAKAIQLSDDLMEATLQMNEEVVAKLITQAHSANTSPNFYNNEQSLRSIIELAYISRVDDYLTIQELPSGNGYADLVFLPKKSVNKPAMVIELKWNKSAKGAIDQIKDRNYVQAVENYGGDILLVGINYNKKSKEHTCIIEKYVKK